MKTSYSKLNIIVLLLEFSIINRLMYSILKTKEFNEILKYRISLKGFNSDFELSVLFSFLLIFFLWLGYYFLKYNTPFAKAPKSFGTKHYEITEKSHSSLFWSVICYPLLLCPLPDFLYLFIIAISIICIFTLSYLKHSNELVLNPIVFAQGFKLYLFEDKEKKTDSFYVLLKSSKDIETIKVTKIENQLYKEFLEKK